MDSVTSAINQVTNMKNTFEKKVETFRKRVAERIEELAQAEFSKSIVDDVVVGGSPRRANVSVKITEQGDTTIVIAQGEDAVFVEFGAGVYHNGSVGSSQHPKGKEFGFTIGSYGKGRGARKAWGFYDEDGVFKITHGTPTTMPMYNAVKQTMTEIGKIAREVFG